MLDRMFTDERLGFALARGDEDFRLAVDRALSRVYASGEIETVYARWFGKIDDGARAFFRQNTLTE
jgi:polar amino acid transport system substrate-binding protein